MAKYHFCGFFLRGGKNLGKKTSLDLGDPLKFGFPSIDSVFLLEKQSCVKFVF